MKRLLIFAGVLILLGGTWAAAQSGAKGGALKVDTPGMVLTIKAGKDKATGKKKEVPVTPGKGMALPAGTYQVSSVGLFAQDASNTLWGLETLGELGKLASVEVTEGQTTAVQGGGPLQVKTSVSITSSAPPAKAASKAKATAALPPAPKGKTVTVLVRYVGQAGEQYGPKVMQGKRPGPRCVVRLVDEEGKVLSQGEYTYGANVGGG
jgi:hypothetical protein